MTWLNHGRQPQNLPRRQITWRLAPLLLLALWALPAGAESGIGEVTLFGEEEFTIKAATKTEIPLSKAPGSVTVISAQRIRESGARTIPEILRMVGGVNVRWNPMVQSLDMRSFGQNPFTSRVLLLIDGVPYNSWNKGGFPQHPGFDFFMLQNIKRLEIVRGAGSALYGENAYWGVINIVTLSGEDLQGGKVELFGGDLESQSLAAVYGKKIGEGSILASARIQKGQLPVGFWFEDNASEIQGTDIFVKATYKNFELSYFRHEDELDGFDSPLGFIPGATFRSAPEISQTVDIFALKSSHELRDGLTFDADISYAQRDGSRCSACHAAPQNPAFVDEADHGFQLIGDFRFNVRLIPSHDILIGVEGRQVDTGDHTDQLLTPEEDPRVILDYTKVAAYIQDQISLADDKVHLTLGARYDGSNDLFESEISPRVALVYNPNEQWVFRGGWSTAYRYPNFNELYTDSWFFNAETPAFAFPLAVFEPNPELRPEEIRTSELGFEFRVHEDLSAKMDFYRSEVRDFIVLAFRQGAGPSGVRSENHPDDATIQGFELEFRWRPTERLTGFVNYSFQETDQEGNLVDSGGQPFEFVYAPENKINLGAYFGPWEGVRGALEVQWRDSVQGPAVWSNATGVDELESYTLVNARLSWDLPVSFGSSSEAIRLSLYGRNLLDEEITETLLPINMQLPGSTFFGAIELRY